LDSSHGKNQCAKIVKPAMGNSTGGFLFLQVVVFWGKLALAPFALNCRGSKHVAMPISYAMPN
jgi:hypothetical protein